MCEEKNVLCLKFKQISFHEKLFKKIYFFSKVMMELPSNQVVVDSRCIQSFYGANAELAERMIWSHCLHHHGPLTPTVVWDILFVF